MAKGIDILLGEDSSKRVSEAVVAYRDSYAELSSAIYSYFETSREGVIRGDPYKDQDWLKKIHQVIYMRTDDNFSKRIEEATTKLKTGLQAYVK